MTGRIYPIFVPLISPDAETALRLRAALDAMCLENPLLGYDMGAVNEVILKAHDELALEMAVDILLRGHHIPFAAGAPQVAYRESITRAIEWEYTHKRQTGGKDCFAKVKIRFEPGEPGCGFVFEDAARGAVPASFVPAVAVGLETAARHGPVADFPLLDLHCTLVGGDYRDVDSTPETFEIAARTCLREALPKARPRLLEPVMNVEVVTPEGYLGDVIGDLNSRRGLVQGMERSGEARVVSAQVPLANLFGYVHTLRSMTRGQAQCEMTFAHYEELPGPGNDDPFAPAAALR